jgi:hypothetical protein
VLHLFCSLLLALFLEERNCPYIYNPTNDIMIYRRNFQQSLILMSHNTAATDTTTPLLA